MIKLIFSVIIVIFGLSQIKNKRNGIKFLKAIVAIIIFAYCINSILSFFADKYDTIKNFCDLLKVYLNIFDIVFSITIVAFFNTKINSLEYSNKAERAIWRVYDASVRCIEELEWILDFDNNIFIQEDNNKFEERDYLDLVLSNNIHEKANMLNWVIEELRDKLKFVMETYIKFLDDDVYGEVAQIYYEASRYKFSKERKNQEYDIEYLKKLIKYLNASTCIWYKYYSEEFNRYKLKNNKANMYKVKSGYSLRKMRLEKFLDIEEFLYVIKARESENGLTEKTYRMIENGRLKLAKKDMIRIAEFFEINYDDYFVKDGTGYVKYSKSKYIRDKVNNKLFNR